ncbi:cell division protein FtsH [Gracilibacillus boraciitolerans JCM 21714]|uniref:Cell division protein FtsH n=1 Tax=Gracilibacillus boraciitolerans JCM 21714 TaxID=1298598 RepID=W4VLF3_9BACI|nr:cell division protein FtsH [Gracilibacillus boraciitolerans JCM 21714]
MLGELEAEDKSFVTNILNSPGIVESVEQTAEDQGILNVKEEEQPSGWVTFLTTMIPFVIIFILFFFLLNQAQGGGSRVMNFGKSKAKMYNEEKKKVGFRDVAGADEEKQELVEVVDFLKDPRKFTAIGAKIPKGGFY